MAKVKFPSEMPSANNIGGNDKMMIAKEGTGETYQATFDQAKQYLTITSIEIQPVAPGELPAGPVGQNRKMEVTAVGTWTYGGSNVGSNADGFKTTFWWTGSAWVNNGSVRVTGQTGANGANGKTTEPFDPAISYSPGSQIYFGGSEIYTVLSNTIAGETPTSHPAKFKLELKGGGEAIENFNGWLFPEGYNNFSNGYYNIITNAFVNTTAYKRTPLFDAVGVKRVMVTSIFRTDVGLRGLDENGNNIWRVGSTEAGAGEANLSVKDRIFEVPEGVKYIDLSMPTSQTTTATNRMTFYVENKPIKKTIQAVENQSGKFNSDLYSYIRFDFKSNYDTGYLNLTTGAFTSSIGHRTSPHIKVRKGETIKLRSYTGNGFAAIAFYKSLDGEVFTFSKSVDGNPVIFTGETTGRNDYVFVAPEDGYIRMSTNTNGNSLALDHSYYELNKTKTVTQSDIDNQTGPLGVVSVKKYNSDRLNNSVSDLYTLRNWNFRAKHTGGMISFIDDDGVVDLYSYYHNALKSRGLNYGASVVPGWIIDGRMPGVPYAPISVSQLKEICNEPEVCELLNHGYLSQRLGDISRLEQENDLIRAHKWFISQDLIPKGYVYPQGSFNDAAKESVSILYPMAYSTFNGINLPSNIRNHEIKRYNFGRDSGLKLASLIPIIEEAILNNGWIIIMTHVGGYNHYAEWRTDFEAILNYVRDSPIECVLPSDGFRRMGNFHEVINDKVLTINLTQRAY